MTACRDAGGIFGKACQIRCQLNEYTIAFNRANNSGHGFARSKLVGILFPCAEQLFVRKGQATLLINRLNNNSYRLSDRKTDGRMRNPRNGNAVNGQKPVNSCTDIEENAEVLHVGYLSCDHITGAKL